MNINQGQLHLTTNFNNARILVIEDNDEHWVLIQQALKHSLSEVIALHVGSAEDALTQITAWGAQEWELPKLVILDLYLPTRNDGLSVLQHIKQMEPSISSIPVVVFSFSEARIDIQASYQAGAAAYMIKPLESKSWLTVFEHLRQYWWETVHLPNVNYKM